MEHVGVVLLGHANDVQLEVADNLVVIGDQGQVDFDALAHARVVEAFGDTFPVDLVGQCHAEVVVIALVIGVLDVCQQPAPMAHQM